MWRKRIIETLFSTAQQRRGYELVLKLPNIGVNKVVKTDGIFESSDLHEVKNNLSHSSIGHKCKKYI